MLTRIYSPKSDKNYLGGGSKYFHIQRHLDTDVKFVDNIPNEPYCVLCTTHVWVIG